MTGPKLMQFFSQLRSGTPIHLKPDVDSQIFAIFLKIDQGLDQGKGGAWVEIIVDGVYRSQRWKHNRSLILTDSNDWHLTVHNNFQIIRKMKRKEYQGVVDQWKLDQAEKLIEKL